MIIIIMRYFRLQEEVVALEGKKLMNAFLGRMI